MKLDESLYNPSLTFSLTYKGQAEVKPSKDRIYKSMIYIDGVPHEGIDTRTIKDWSRAVVPFYSWNGCGGVYFLKVFPQFVLCAYCGDPPFAKIYFDEESFEYDDEFYEEDIYEIREIMGGAEIQAIRELVSSQPAVSSEATGCTGC